jgi:hypothetical protein
MVAAFVLANGQPRYIMPELQVPPEPTADTHPAATFFKRSWIALILIVILVILARVFRNDLATPSVARACIVLILAAGLLYGANRRFFSQLQSSGDPLGVRFVIAFDSVVFVIVGLAATILSCSHWETAVLLAGSCLLIGGFFGLLFGYPQGVAQQAQPLTADPQAPARDKNLLADSAATLGKVITGFTLAKASQISSYYSSLCHTLGPALGAQEPAAANVLAGVIVAYFLATGFLSGLLLPPYFMSDQF